MGTNIHGKGASLAISTDGTTYNTVGGVVDVSISFSDDLAEVTDKDSAGHKQYISGHDDATVEVSARYEEDDTYQADVLTAAVDKTVRYFRIRPTTGSGKLQYIGQGFVSEMSVDAPNEDVVGLSFTIQVSGGLAKSAQ